MSAIICKKGKSKKHIKNGLVRGLQRYRCKDCKCNFTNTGIRGKHPAMKALSVLLYSMGNMSYRMIGKLLGLSYVTVYEWIGSEAEKIPVPAIAADVEIVMIDEMWHFIQKKTQKLWLWRAYDPIKRKTLAWVLGGRDDTTCQRFLNNIGIEGKTFITDHWEAYHRLIREDQLFTVKDLTFPIEQDNSNIRHYLARFRRRTKVVSKSATMIDLSLRLYHYYHQPENYAALSDSFLSIFN